MKHITRLLILASTLWFLSACTRTIVQEKLVPVSDGEDTPSNTGTSSPQGVGQGNGMKQHIASKYGFILEYSDQLSIEVESPEKLKVNNKDSKKPEEALTELTLEVFPEGKIENGVIKSFNALKHYGRHLHPECDFKEYDISGALAISCELNEGSSFKSYILALTFKGDVLTFTIEGPTEGPWKQTILNIVENFSFDRDAPHALSVNYSPVDGDDNKAHITVVAEDARSSFAEASFYISSLSEGKKYEMMNGPIEEHIIESKLDGNSLSTKLQLELWHPPGLCTLGGFSVIDNHGNGRWYTSLEGKPMYQESLGKNSSGDYFYKKTSIPVVQFECNTNIIPDTELPEVLSVHYPKKVLAGQSFFFDIQYKEDLSGIVLERELNLRRHPHATWGYPQKTKITISNIPTEKLGPGFYRYKGHAPSFLASDLYTLEFIYVDDHAGNSQHLALPGADPDTSSQTDNYSKSYDANGDYNPSDSGIPIVRIEVENTKVSDMMGPEITNIEVIEAGPRSVFVEFDCHDIVAKCQTAAGMETSAKATFEHYRWSNRELGRFNCDYDSHKEQRIRLRCNVPQFLPSGSYKLYSLEAHDTTGLKSSLTGSIEFYWFKSGEFAKGHQTTEEVITIFFPEPEAPLKLNTKEIP